MDHQTAVKLSIPGRYISGELSAEERDDFEEHFASCTACLDEVWTASAFAANARAVFRDRAEGRREPTPATSWRWFRWQVAVPVFASLALAAIAVYQNSVTIPGLRAPQGFAPAVVLEGVTRSAPPAIVVGKFLHFEIGVTAPENGRVWVELTNAAGRVLSAGWVNSPAANEPLDIYFPIRLAPAFYSVVVRAAPTGAELARGRFEITSRENRTP